MAIPFIWLSFWHLCFITATMAHVHTYAHTQTHIQCVACVCVGVCARAFALSCYILRHHNFQYPSLLSFHYLPAALGRLSRLGSLRAAMYCMALVVKQKRRQQPKLRASNAYYVGVGVWVAKTQLCVHGCVCAWVCVCMGAFNFGMHGAKTKLPSITAQTRTDKRNTSATSVDWQTGRQAGKQVAGGRGKRK